MNPADAEAAPAEPVAGALRTAANRIATAAGIGNSRRLRRVRSSMWLRPLLFVVAAGCADAPEAPAPTAAESAAASRPTPAAPKTYATSVAQLKAARGELARALATEEDTAAVIERARATLLDALMTDLLPAWSGTPWAMQGTATEPGDDPIACGYFVSTILRDAGLSLHRVKFGQAAALRIQQATTPGDVDVHTFFSIPPAKLAKKIAALGDGLYIIGLNVHVGFVVVRDGEVRFVHASYTGDRVVTDEPLATATAIANSQPQGYFVSELFSTDASVRKWLADERYTLPAA